MVKKILFSAALLGIIAMGAGAQTPPLPPALMAKFTPQPMCSTLINETGFSVYGNIETDRVTLPSGEMIYHKSNFKLEKDATTQICASGPFFDGGKLILTLRTLLPVFECKTKLGEPITLTATPLEPVGYDWKATCYD